MTAIGGWHGACRTDRACLFSACIARAQRRRQVLNALARLHESLMSRRERARQCVRQTGIAGTYEASQGCANCALAGVRCERGRQISTRFGRGTYGPTRRVQRTQGEDAHAPIVRSGNWCRAHEGRLDGDGRAVRDGNPRNACKFSLLAHCFELDSASQARSLDFAHASHLRRPFPVRCGHSAAFSAAIVEAIRRLTHELVINLKTATPSARCAVHAARASDEVIE
jgi:hypothetical protein